MTCTCDPADRHFGVARAQAELAAYRRRGPTGTALALLRMVRSNLPRVDTLLDIGSGVGVLHHELLSGSVRSAIHVEGARAYVDAARAEAERRGHTGRIEFLHGDFVALAQGIGTADLVTLDRVLCCYPGFEPLLLASISKARRYWAASFPLDRLYVRLHTTWQNSLRRRAGNPFRTFVHPVVRIHHLLRLAGFQPLAVRCGLVWEVVLAARQDTA